MGEVRSRSPEFCASGGTGFASPAAVGPCRAEQETPPPLTTLTSVWWEAACPRFWRKERTDLCLEGFLLGFFFMSIESLHPKPKPPNGLLTPLVKSAHLWLLANAELPTNWLNVSILAALFVAPGDACRCHQLVTSRPPAPLPLHRHSDS